MNTYTNDINELERRLIRLNEEAANTQSALQSNALMCNQISDVTNSADSSLSRTWKDLEEVFTSLNTKYKEHLDMMSASLQKYIEGSRSNDDTASSQNASTSSTLDSITAAINNL